MTLRLRSIIALMIGIAVLAIIAVAANQSRATVLCNYFRRTMQFCIITLITLVQISGEIILRTPHHRRGGRIIIAIM